MHSLAQVLAIHNASYNYLPGSTSSVAVISLQYMLHETEPTCLKEHIRVLPCPVKLY